MRKKPLSALKPYIFPLLFAGVVAAGVFFRKDIMRIWADKEALRAWVGSLGAMGFLGFLVLQVLQVVIFVVPGELTQAAGGFVFGFWAGLALNILGIAAGSMANYAIGKAFGRPFVAKVVGEAKLGRLEGLAADPKSSAAYYLLFLVPGIPKDIICYLAGIGRVSPLVFLAASTASRVPGIVGSTLLGSASYRGRYGLAFSLLAVSAVFMVLGIVWRKPLEAFLGRHIGRKP